MERIPRQKSLFGIESEKGLPIGNLTSQFFANIYLNGLDQFIKHSLKCRFYMRYVDDLVLIGEDRAKCLEWHEAISNFLSRSLNLKLKEKEKIQPVSNGIDFLGYIVRADYMLCRNRVVNNLKGKLLEFKKALISAENGVLRVLYPEKTLTAFHACLNSYLGHFSHADTFKLTQSLFEENPWLGFYFVLTEGKVFRKCCPPRNFSSITRQYRFFTRYLAPYFLFFQVGCFYEFYGYPAIMSIRELKLKRIKQKYGFRVRCGIGEKALDRYVKTAIETNRPVAIVRQTGYISGRVLERKLDTIYYPLNLLGYMENL
jgi:hypothetical protein